MKKFHINRLLKLANHLRTQKLGHKFFNFNRLTDSDGGNICGTSGCAMGECPIVWPRHFKFDFYSVHLKKDLGPPSDSDYHIMDFFGLEAEEKSHLFYPEEQNVEKFGGKVLTTRATKKAVARGIETFCKRKLAEMGKV